MKLKIQFFFLFVSTLFLVSCGTSEHARPETDISKQGNANLADILRKNTTLTVSGTGDDVKVVVRGFSTFMLNTQPLYVIDGFPIGNNYAQANSMLNPAEVVDVRVLRNTSELVVYGEDGTNGVILITTRKEKKLKG